MFMFKIVTGNQEAYGVRGWSEAVVRIAAFSVGNKPSTEIQVFLLRILLLV